MRLTQVLCKINRHRIFAVRWEQIKRRKAPISRELQHIQKLGHPTVDSLDYLKKTQEEIVPLEIDPEVQPYEPIYKKLELNENHPNYKADPCLCLDDTSVLLQGLDQAKLLLNSVHIQEGLPKEVEDAIGTRAIPFQDTRVKRSIMYSHVYDAQQVKLPIKKDPERPAWVFPRDFGIDATRKFHLTMTQMLQLCNFAVGKASISDRTQITDAHCCVRLEKEGNTFEIHNRADFLVTSKVPTPPLTIRTSGNATPLPNLDPLHFTVSIPNQHFYHGGSVFPVARDFAKSHPHTAFFLYDPSEVKNVYEEPVTESQFFSRTLVKAFAIAGSRAQQLYGDNIKELPEPLTLQVVHTDNKKYHFGVLQLNTLNLEENSPERNIFWMMPQSVDLFSECGYVNGRPVLENYNPEIFQRILSFYCHGLP